MIISVRPWAIVFIRMKAVARRTSGRTSGGATPSLMPSLWCHCNWFSSMSFTSSSFITRTGPRPWSVFLMPMSSSLIVIMTSMFPAMSVFSAATPVSASSEISVPRSWMTPSPHHWSTSQNFKAWLNYDKKCKYSLKKYCALVQQLSKQNINALNDQKLEIEGFHNCWIITIVFCRLYDAKSWFTPSAKPLVTSSEQKFWNSAWFNWTKKTN